MTIVVDPLLSLLLKSYSSKGITASGPASPIKALVGLLTTPPVCKAVISGGLGGAFCNKTKPACAAAAACTIVPKGIPRKPIVPTEAAKDAAAFIAISANLTALFILKAFS